MSASLGSGEPRPQGQDKIQTDNGALEDGRLGIVTRTVTGAVLMALLLAGQFPWQAPGAAAKGHALRSAMVCCSTSPCCMRRVACSAAGPCVTSAPTESNGSQWPCLRSLPCGASPSQVTTASIDWGLPAATCNVQEPPRDCARSIPSALVAPTASDKPADPPPRA